MSHNKIIKNVLALLINNNVYIFFVFTFIKFLLQIFSTWRKSVSHVLRRLHFLAIVIASKQPGSTRSSMRMNGRWLETSMVVNSLSLTIANTALNQIWELQIFTTNEEDQGYYRCVGSSEDLVRRFLWPYIPGGWRYVVNEFLCFGRKKKRPLMNVINILSNEIS